MVQLKEKEIGTMEDTKESNRREQRKILKNIVLISLAFLLNFTGFQGLSRLQSSLHQVEGMGVINQGILYAVLIVACMLLPKVLMAKIGHKWSIAVSILGYIIWMAANGYAVWGTMITASVIVGIAAGPLWAAQGSYFTLSAPRYAELTGNTEEATVTKFFGIFFGLFQVSGITGSIISSTILVSVPPNSTIDPDDPVLDLCGPKACPYHEVSNPNLEEPAESVVWTLLGVFIAIGLVAVVIVAVFVDQLPAELRLKDASTCQESGNLMMDTIKHYRYKETLLLLLITMYSGMEAAFYNAEFNQAYVSCSVGIWMVGYVTLPFGFVNACTSFGSARLAKYTGQLPIFISALIVDLAIQFTLLFWMPKPDQSWVLFVISGLWGYTDGIWQTHVVALYGLVFPNETEAAFSCRMASSSLGYVVAFGYSYFLCTSVKIYILTAVLVTGILGYLAVEIPRRRDIKAYNMEGKNTGEVMEVVKANPENSSEGYINTGYI